MIEPNERPSSPIQDVRPRLGRAPVRANKASKRQEQVRQWILLIPLATAVLGSIGTQLTEEYTEFLSPLFFIGALLITISMLHQRRLFSTNEELSYELQTANAHLDTLHRLQFELNQSLDIEQVSHTVLAHMLETLQADSGALWLRPHFDLASSLRCGSDQAESGNNAIPRGRSWHLAASQGWPEPVRHEVLKRWNMALDANGNGETEQSYGVQDVESSRDLQEILQQSFGTVGSNTSSAVSVPICWKDEIIGTILIMRWDGPFVREEADLLREIALVTGPSLENALLYQRTVTRADIDGLTNLYNHRAIQERLTQELARTQRTRFQNPNSHFSIAVFDLTDFKLFNDTYGHAMGDEVLRTVSNTLRKTFRVSDMVARYGGDEFLAILPEADSAGAMIISQRAIDALRAQPFVAEDGSQIIIRLTCGIAVFPQDGDNGADLFQAADARLYEAKHQGRQIIPYVNNVQEEEKTPIVPTSLWGNFGVLDALITAIDNRDHYTRRHSEQVMGYSLMIARELQQPHEILEAVRVCGLLYDVGKIAVPDAILRKPGLLSADEVRLMQQHCRFGTMMVQEIDQRGYVLEGVQSHHESYDGSGYPEGLKGEAIPWMGRLLAVADSFAAMTTDRPYRKALLPEVALQELLNARGVRFDPALVDAFARVLQDVVAGSKTLQTLLLESLQFSEEVRRATQHANGHETTDTAITLPAQVASSSR